MPTERKTRLGDLLELYAETFLELSELEYVEPGYLEQKLDGLKRVLMAAALKQGAVCP